MEKQNTSLISSEFLKQAIFRLNENTPRIEKSLELLSEEEVWKKPNEASNSIGNLILHLCGNITQYIISSLGETKDLRERDKEFSTTGGYNKSELMIKMNTTIDEAIKIIGSQSEESLLKKRSVQDYQISGLAIILHVVEHYSFHVGQITYWTKLLKNKDLGFYAGVDLNKKNE